MVIVRRNATDVPIAELPLTRINKSEQENKRRLEKGGFNGNCGDRVWWLRYLCCLWLPDRPGTWSKERSSV